jgi:putative ABC transport system permease protein
LQDLHQSDAVIVDEVGAKDKLAKILPDGSKMPLRIGDELELNDHHATVVGIAKTKRTFQSMPVIYTTYSRATNFVPQQRQLLSFVLVKAAPGQDVMELTCITLNTGLAAHLREDFKKLMLNYYLKKTSMPISFGVTVAMGFVVGAAIAGQMFYNFTLENIRQFGALKAMGTQDFMLLRMILVQALFVGIVGWVLVFQPYLALSLKVA